MNMISRKDILTIRETAALFKISTKTAYALAERQELPCFKVGGQWRFHRAAIETWVQNHTKIAASLPPPSATPLQGNKDPVLAEIVRHVVTAYEPERIYLFGSKARGNEGPDSDYDLMVVVPDDAPI